MSTKVKTEIDRIDSGGEPLEIPDVVRDRLSDEVIDELLAGARTEEEIVGPARATPGLHAARRQAGRK
jgi:hypothetical protein